MRTFDEVYTLLPGNGWLSEDEARLLWEVANATKGDILEVGCHQGRSSVLLAETFRRLHCVDPFVGFDSDDPSGEKACTAWLTNLASYLHVSLEMNHVENWTPQPMGFCYLDGDHTFDGTVAQITKALACKPHAIGIHDVNDTGGGEAVKRAALAMLGPWTRRSGRLATWEGLR